MSQPVVQQVFPYASVCSGAEAFGEEWERLGYKAVFHAEIEPHASSVLRYRYPDIPNFGDFTTIATPGGPQPAQPIRLLCGGTPCQDFSVAGLRAGVAGDKGNLTLEFLLLAKRLRPEWLLWENVPGVFSSLSHDAADPTPPPPPLDLELDGAEMVTEEECDAEESHAFHSFLAGLRELGYGFAYRTLDLQNWGVPQRRKRVFVVAHLGDWTRAAAVLFESDCLPGNFATSAGKRADITQSLTRSAGTGGPDASHAQAGLLVPSEPIPFDTTQITSAANRPRCEPGMPCHTLGQGQHAPAIAFGGNNTSGPIKVATCLNAHGGGHGRLDFESETFLVQPVAFGWAKSPSQTMQVSEITDPLLASRNSEPAVYQCHGGDVGPLGTLRAGHGDVQSGVPFLSEPLRFGDSQQDTMLFEAGVSTTLPAGTNNNGGHMQKVLVTAAFKAGQGAAAGGIGYSESVSPTLGAAASGTQLAPALLHNAAVRRLMPLETERLMGWQDGWTRYGINDKGKQYELADGPRYRLCGNGWGAPVVTWIAERIKMVDELMRGMTR